VLRIGTWNVEYADVAATNARRADVLSNHSADIWVLTETHDALQPPGVAHAAHSFPRPRYGARVKEGSRWTSIWSRFPCEPADVTLSDPERTIVARILTPTGALVVYGTVMPWNGDKGRMGERPGARGWSEFYRVAPQQIAEWRALQARYPDAALCVAGDFNVDMGAGAFYGSREAIVMLRDGLNTCALTCISEPSRFPAGRLVHPPIDHIALPSAWAHRARVTAAWEGRVGSPRLSDHSGFVVSVDLN
jgi:hypothetical protein